MTKTTTLLLVAAALVLALFLAISAATAGPGFPIDDAWIHQTYARNLARTGRWQYVPGEISAGSTAPLWTLLLTLGYLLQLPYLYWAYLLGFASLFLLAWAGQSLWRSLWPALPRPWLAALALIAAWPLVWAAASGMETLFFIALALTILALHQIQNLQSPFFLGLLSGLLILTRPDGLILLILLAASLLLFPGPAAPRLRCLLLFLVAALLPLLPYFALNYQSSGRIWPNTFYAKQAEYALALAEPFLARLIRLLFFSLGGPESGWRGMSGAHLLLLPGLLIAAWRSLRADWAGRRLQSSLPLLWAAGHIFLYAWRLPVTYHHGRYLLAALPIWILYGLAGWHTLLAFLQARLPQRTARLLPLATGGIFASLLLIFLLLGAQQYAANVAFIEGEMVNVAHWLRQNTQPDELIASHDIGAIGYFAERPLLDLAGLISPEVVPLLTDDPALAAHIRQSHADYLVTAPGWPYPLITAATGATLLYTTGYTPTLQANSNNMTVYRLTPP